MSLFSKYGITPSVRDTAGIANVEAAMAVYEHLAAMGCLGPAPRSWDELSNYERQSWTDACGRVHMNAYFTAVKALMAELKSARH